jgi:epoxyqueuosine reductase
MSSASDQYKKTVATTVPSTELPGRIRDWARELGFAEAAIASTDISEDVAWLDQWLLDGHHADMRWMADSRDLRADPAALRPGTRSVISVRMDYGMDTEEAWPALRDTNRAYISRYALGRDYHKTMRQRLAKLAARIDAEAAPHGYRVFADSAPALEKALARNAGLGWIGKNTLLLNREAGSAFFLGEIYTDLPLPADAPRASSHCGSCTACLDICPTKAFVGPYKLDARRCISYLTIEHRGAIPEELRSGIGNRIFGCDDCQLVCPWNRYAQPAGVGDFKPRHGLDSAGLLELYAWDEAHFMQRTEGMPLRRTGYRGWRRNISVALGNAPASPAIRDALEQALHSETDPMLREHMAWALDRQRAASLPEP